MEQVTESDYREAIFGDAKIRQYFLDTIDLENSQGFIYRVRYSQHDVPNKNARMVCLFPGRVIDGVTNLPSEDHRRNGFYKSEILILPKAFELSLEAFLSALIDHEGFHAMQHHIRTKDAWDVVDLANNVTNEEEKAREFMATLEISAYFYQQSVECERKIPSGERMANYLALQRERNRFSRARTSAKQLDDLAIKLAITPKISETINRLVCFLDN